MQEKRKEVEHIALEVFSRMEKKEEWMPFLKLSSDMILRKQCYSLNIMKMVVIEAIQIGNYRRALLFLLFIDETLARFEEKEKEIKREVSLYILGE